jgi:deoxyhypusine synthase
MVDMTTPTKELNPSMPDPKGHPEAERLGLVPMRMLDVSQAPSTSDLLREMSATAFTGRALGEAADVMETMLKDRTCLRVMTLSGAMTMAGLGGLIRDSIQRGWVDCLIATGALVGHGLVESLGMPHYKADPRLSDEEYFRLRLNRVYDTLEPEQNLNELEKLIRGILDGLADKTGSTPVGTVDLLETLGNELPGEGILQVCARKHVPVIIPAFTDSELGLDFAVHRVHRQRLSKSPLIYDAFRDLEFFRELCQGAVAENWRLGIYTVGGGVPRNWAQQVGPYVDVRNTRLALNDPPLRYTYGIRVCPDPVHYGHLSGCTYSEGVSWGKFLPIAEGGRHAEVLLDATVGWPILARAMIDRGL